jgi:hypothetical protein
MAHVNRVDVRSALTAALAASIIALTACASDDDESSADATESPAAEGAPVEQEISDDAQPASTAPAPEPTGSGGPVAPAPDRLLIVDVTVGIEVADVGKAVTTLIDIGERHEAQVYGSDVRLTSPETSTGTVVFKVPPQNVEAMIAEATTLGRQVSRLQNTDDVTDRVTDLETRIITAQQSVDRVQRLLIEAIDLGEVVLLEGELTTRQTALEGLLAEQRNLGNRTALATLTVDLSTAPLETLVEPVEPPAEDDDGIGDAFAKGGRAFVTAGAAVLIFIGYTAPFLTVALVIGVIAWLVSRRRARRSRSAAPLRPPTPGADQRTTEPDSVGAARS